MSAALDRVKELFGPNGYRIYAEALGRQPTTFHASVSNPDTLPSRLVILTCKIMAEAKERGLCPRQMLAQLSEEPVLNTEDGLSMSLQFTLGTDAVNLLSIALTMSRKAVIHAISAPEARYQPHFKLITVALLMLKRATKQHILELPPTAMQKAA